MTELTKEMEKSIKEVLWDYHWNIKHSNAKENIYMDNLAKQFPNLNREALKDVGKYKK
jgi:ribonuclease HI